MVSVGYDGVSASKLAVPTADLRIEGPWGGLKHDAAHRSVPAKRQSDSSDGCLGQTAGGGSCGLTSAAIDSGRQGQRSAEI